MKGRHNGPAWLLTSCFLLPLITMSIVWLNRPHTVRAATAQAVSATPSPALPPVKDDDGDGDELLEHWNNPLFSKEERFQLGGMALFFGVGAVTAWRRRAALRRITRED